MRELALEHRRSICANCFRNVSVRLNFRTILDVGEAPSQRHARAEDGDGADLHGRQGEGGVGLLIEPGALDALDQPGERAARLRAVTVDDVVALVERVTAEEPADFVVRGGSSG